MASLVLTIGQLEGTVTANNTKAANLLSAYADAIGAQGTNQQKANQVVRALVQHMREQAQRHRANTIATSAISTAQGEINGLAWED